MQKISAFSMKQGWTCGAKSELQNVQRIEAAVDKIKIEWHVKRARTLSLSVYIAKEMKAQGMRTSQTMNNSK